MQPRSGREKIKGKRSTKWRMWRRRFREKHCRGGEDYKKWTRKEQQEVKSVRGGATKGDGAMGRMEGGREGGKRRWREEETCETVGRSSK